ncbi:MAG: LysR family transcriptional regulator, partial [Planctomycetaceae bacterium]|nr:LysR family transcriptional regulator [Planctomycetaceae bacterium]
ETLRTLLVFSEVESLAAAGDKLGITQPAVSRKLAQFHAGVPREQALLEKRGKQLQLTDRGRTALPAIRELVEKYDQLVKFLRSTTVAPATIRVGLGGFAARFYLPAALAKFQKLFSDCDTDVRQMRGHDRIVGVANGSLDMAIVSHDVPQIRTTAELAVRSRCRLNIELLSEQPVCVMAVRDSDAGRSLKKHSPKTAVPLEELAHWPVLGMDGQSGVRRQMERHFPDRARRLSFVAETGGWMAAKEFARQNLGVAVVPVAVVTTEDLDAFHVRMLNREFLVRHFLIHRDVTLSAAESTLKEELMQAAKRVTKNAAQLLKASGP